MTFMRVTYASLAEIKLLKIKIAASRHRLKKEAQDE